jgi:hypothetical protein
MNGKVESLTIENWDENQTGLIVDENENWLLVKHIAGDYVIDGYRIYRKDYIAHRENGDNEKKIERVFRLRNIRANIPEGFIFSDPEGLLRWCQEVFGLFEFQDDTQDELFYGRINSIEESILIIDFIDASGITEKEYDFEFDLDAIRAISFSSDYFESIRVLWIDENKVTLTP